MQSNALQSAFDHLIGKVTICYSDLLLSRQVSTLCFDLSSRHLKIVLARDYG